MFVASLGALLWSLYYSAALLFPKWRFDSSRNVSETLDIPVSQQPEIKYDVSRIVQAHLFGRPNQPNSELKQAAPETKLQISLLGLITSADSRVARAIIGVGGRKVRPYAVGQNIDGTDAALYAVERKRVLLKRGEALESLALKRPELDWENNNPNDAG